VKISPPQFLPKRKGLRDKTFLDFDSKYKNLESRHKVPGSFTEEEKRQIQEAAVLIHKILGLRHYSRSDFILHPKRRLFVFEVNTLPELSHRSSFIKSLEAVGGNIKEFLSHLISKALRR
jgi:D-alanine-D-alanine ligase